ncbi:UNVERIFIED_CONTAM: hypothetical protein Sradi_1171100 [Sesamum radiatum]|uniref:Uncharacterized protein n=1 Tax=Sesamum radiatum TaxID=300843 RepID=A0AAW2UK95_SESRA
MAGAQNPPKLGWMVMKGDNLRMDGGGELSTSASPSLANLHLDQRKGVGWVLMNDVMLRSIVQTGMVERTDARVRELHWAPRVSLR